MKKLSLIWTMILLVVFSCLPACGDWLQVDILNPPTCSLPSEYAMMCCKTGWANPLEVSGYCDQCEYFVNNCTDEGISIALKDIVACTGTQIPDDGEVKVRIEFDYRAEAGVAGCWSRPTFALRSGHINNGLMVATAPPQASFDFDCHEEGSYVFEANVSIAHSFFQLTSGDWFSSIRINKIQVLD